MLRFFVPQMTRPAQLALAIGTVLGVALGLYAGWVAAPVEYVDTEPVSLRADHKADYVLMVAEVFSVDRDVAAAEARLALLGPPADVLPAAFETALSLGRPDTDLSRLAALGAALGLTTPAMEETLP